MVSGTDLVLDRVVLGVYHEHSIVSPREEEFITRYLVVRPKQQGVIETEGWFVNYLVEDLMHPTFSWLCRSEMCWK